MTKFELQAIVARNIRKQRKIHGLTIAEMASLLDLTPGAFGLIERGDRGLTIHNLFKLSNIFGQPTDYFFLGTT